MVGLEPKSEEASQHGRGVQGVEERVCQSRAKHDGEGGQPSPKKVDVRGEKAYCRFHKVSAGHLNDCIIPGIDEKE